jgi:predicted component of type VI protein secretion system
MIKLIITFDTPLSQKTSAVQDDLRALFVKYRTSGKIIADFIYVTDSVIELRFNTLESAQAFEQEAMTLNGTIATFEYI